MLLQISAMRLHGHVRAAKKAFLNTDLISAMNEVLARRVFVSRVSRYSEKRIRVKVCVPIGSFTETEP
jgi:hypothetical protein